MTDPKKHCGNWKRIASFNADEFFSNFGLSSDVTEAYKNGDNLSFTYDAAKNVFIRQDGPFTVATALSPNEVYEFSLPDGRQAQLKWIETPAGPREIGVNEAFSTYALMQNHLDENTMQLVYLLKNSVMINTYKKVN